MFKTLSMIPATKQHRIDTWACVCKALSAKPMISGEYGYVHAKRQ